MEKYNKNGRIKKKEEHFPLKKHTHRSEFDSFPMLKHFSDELSGNINKWGFLQLYKEMCQHLESRTSLPD